MFFPGPYNEPVYIQILAPSVSVQHSQLHTPIKTSQLKFIKTEINIPRTIMPFCHYSENTQNNQRTGDLDLMNVNVFEMVLLANTSFGLKFAASHFCSYS